MDVTSRVEVPTVVKALQDVIVNPNANSDRLATTWPQCKAAIDIAQKEPPPRKRAQNRYYPRQQRRQSPAIAYASTDKPRTHLNPPPTVRDRAPIPNRSIPKSRRRVASHRSTVSHRIILPQSTTSQRTRFHIQAPRISAGAARTTPRTGERVVLMDTTRQEPCIGGCIKLRQ